MRRSGVAYHDGQTNETNVATVADDEEIVQDIGQARDTYVAMFVGGGGKSER